MSPISSSDCSLTRCFPRVSGDEPGVTGLARDPVRFPRVSGDEPMAVNSAVTDTKFSPRERG